MTALLLLASMWIVGCGGGGGLSGPERAQTFSLPAGPAATGRPPAPPPLPPALDVPSGRLRTDATSLLQGELAGAGGSGNLDLTLAPGWNLISIPFDRASYFHGMPPSLYAFEDGTYESVSSADPAALNPGAGFWAFSAEGGAVTVLGAEAAAGADQSIPLHKGWNLVGFPLTRDVAFTVLSVSDGTQAKPLSQALTAGVNAGDGGFVYRYAFVYQDSAYALVDLAGGEGSLPGRGYWVYSLVEGHLAFQVAEESPGTVPGPGAGLAPEAQVTAFVTATSGATLTVGDASVTIPPGSLSSDGTVTARLFRQARVVPYNQDAVPVTKSLEVGVSDTNVVGSLDVQVPLLDPDEAADALALTAEDGLSTVTEEVTVGGQQVFARVMSRDLERLRQDPPQPVSLVNPVVPGLIVYTGVRYAFRNDSAPSILTVRKPQGSGAVAVVLHGINSNGAAVSEPADWLGATGAYPGGVYTFQYDYTKGPGGPAADLSALLQAELAGQDRILDLYAHSFGGIVSRYFAENCRSSKYRVRRIVTFGTPHRGSPLPAELFNRVLINVMAVGTSNRRWWGSGDPTMEWLQVGFAPRDQLGTGVGSYQVVTVGADRYRGGQTPSGARIKIWDGVFTLRFKFLDWIDTQWQDFFDGAANDGVVRIDSSIPQGLFPGGVSVTEDGVCHMDIIQDWSLFQTVLSAIQLGSIPEQSDVRFLQWPGTPGSAPMPSLTSVSGVPGAAVAIDVNLLNSGTQPWTAQSGFGLYNNAASLGLANIPSEVSVPGEILPGQVWKHRITVRVPGSGTSRLEVRLRKGSVSVLPGVAFDIRPVVSGGSGGSTPVPFDGAVFVGWPGRSDSPEIGDDPPTPGAPGSLFQQRLYVKNVGTKTWNSGYGLWNDAQAKGWGGVPARISLDREVRPGEVWPLTLDLRVPPWSGDHQVRFRMEGAAAFGSTLTKTTVARVGPTLGTLGPNLYVSTSAAHHLGGQRVDPEFYAPPTRMEGTSRTSGVQWSTVEIGSTLYAAHVGDSDSKIYVGRRTADGNWGNWNAIPDAGTDLPVSLEYWQGKLCLAFTGKDGRIWWGTMQPDGSQWSGWRDTGRTSTHGPDLASDGAVLRLVHKGGGNDRIYYSSGPPDNASAQWLDTGRDTKDQPSADIYGGRLLIAHRGAGNDRIYYARDADASPGSVVWNDSGRDSHEGPDIRVLGGSVLISHLGAGDDLPYVGRPDRNQWVRIDPAPLEEMHRSSQVGFSLAELDGQLYAAHVGEYDSKIYLGRRNSDGTWGDWSAIDGAATDKPVALTKWQGRLAIAFTEKTGGTDRIWFGFMSPDRSFWTGWRDTFRTSTAGPVLASDAAGSNLVLVHKGSGNDRIYYSNGDLGNLGAVRWEETGRDTGGMPAADMYGGRLYIAHKGSGNSRVYYARVEANMFATQWVDTGRDTFSSPSIAVEDGAVWIGHRGANDDRVYLGNALTNQWWGLEHNTAGQLCLEFFRGRVIIGYPRGRSLWVQWYP